MVTISITIYNVGHPSSLLFFIEKSLDDVNKKIFLIEYSEHIEKILSNLVMEGIIDDIIYYNKMAFVDANTKTDLVDKVNLYFNNLFNIKCVDIKKISKIFACSDVLNPFYIYLYNNNLKATIIEMYENQLSDNRRKISMGKIASKAYYEFVMENNLLDANSPILIDKILDYNSISGSNKTIYNLKNTKIGDVLLRSLNIDRDRKSIDTLIAMNSGWLGNSPRILSYDIIYIYQLMADYLTDGTCISIKRHPNDTRVYLDNDFDNWEELGGYPIEIYGLLNNFHIKYMLSINSTSSDKIKQLNVSVDKEIRLIGYMNYYYILHDLKTIFNVLAHFEKIQIDQHICTDQEFDFLYKTMTNELEKTINQSISVIIVYDDYKWQSLKDCRCDLLIILPKIQMVKKMVKIEKKTTIVWRTYVKAYSKDSYINDYESETLIIGNQEYVPLFDKYRTYCVNKNSKTIVYSRVITNLADYENNCYYNCLEDLIREADNLVSKGQINDCLELLIPYLKTNNILVWVRYVQASLIVNGELRNINYLIGQISANESICYKMYVMLTELYYLSNMEQQYNFYLKLINNVASNIEIISTYYEKMPSEFRNKIDLLKKQLLQLSIPPNTKINYIQIIQNSCFFEENWYISKYLKNETRKNAAEHYLTSGWKKGFDPSPVFSTRLYLNKYPDVKKSELCPLLHYELFGKYEGRTHY